MSVQTRDVITATELLGDSDFITVSAADRCAAVVFGTTLTLDQPVERVRSAMLHASAHGVYEFSVDGRPVTDSVLNPGWTSYEWRLQYQSFDVTALLTSTTSQLRAVVGNGWYRGDLGFEDARANYGEEIGLLALLSIDFADGSRQLVTTSPQWWAQTCEITSNSLYQGQTIDARLRGVPGRALPVRVGAFDHSRLVAQVGPLVRRQECIAPQRIWQSPAGKTLVDFGQNLVGWVRLRVSGPAGTEVVLRHAEVLENDELGTRPLRNAAATDRFVLSGGDDAFEPTLTFHGFRYLEVTGLPGELNSAALEAVVVHSDLRPTISFECSEPLVNRLVQNSVWGQKGNFLSVPTDCPQRDERLGWTGDIAVYAATAASQFDVADFLHSWLLDLAAETADGGVVPVTVPDVLKHGHFPPDYPFRKVGAQAIWSDAAAWVPQELWQRYGDLDRLAEQYPGMVAHLESVLPLLSETGLWDQGMQLADWLDPDAPPDAPWQAKADPGVVATAAFHRSLAFAAEAAALLDRPQDAARWAEEATRVRDAFRSHYLSGTGEGLRVRSDCATVYALAICFGLLKEDECRCAAARLAEVVRESGHLVTTGFAGTPYVTWALSEHGFAEDAYRLLLATHCPSWLYPVTMGATTIWERWDSMLPDGRINPGEMTSFNHYALGAVADWIYQVVAGIRPAAPGFSTIRIQPRPGPGIDWARAAYDSPIGRIEVSWRRTGDRFDLEVSAPQGVPTDVVLPDGTTSPLPAGQGPASFSCDLGFRSS